VSPGVQLTLRLLVLGVLTVVLQVAAVSQMPILGGVSADLVPLVVAAVGLLCGSIPAALFGFGAGLAVDTALVDTLGLSSLIYCVAGYGAGRLRELRDPQATLLPFAVGAGITALTTLGFSVMQFLLGVDAPLSFLLVRQIIATILVNTLIAVPVFALVGRMLAPALPDEPRRRRRRRSYDGRQATLSPLRQA
jgi:rod shape-determining protein MreD